MSWSQKDFNDLETILSLTPDLIPCDLSVICRKTCREVDGNFSPWYHSRAN